MSLNADSHIFWNFVQQNKFAINHNLRLWVCFVVGITTNIMLYLISRARKFLALFASFSLLVISFVVFSQGKDAMGPTRHQHNTQQRYHEEGTWRKLLKNYPNFLFILFDSSHMTSLVINTPNLYVIILNPFAETMILNLKGQERTHPLSFCFLPRMTPCSFCFLCFLNFVCVV